jgi:diguanylate cyclase (GGDEF)-like protein
LPTTADLGAKLDKATQIDGNSQAHAAMTAKSAYAIGIAHARRSWATALAGIALVLLLGSLVTAIVLTQQQAKSHLLATFGLRGTSSATFVSTYLDSQASREQQTARDFLASPRVSRHSFAVVVQALGSDAAVLLDETGRVLDAVPSRPALGGVPLGGRYPSVAKAEHGSLGISNIVASPVTGAAVTSIAVAYPTPAGRRVLSADYHASGLALDALVDHTISYPEHKVFLLDAAGRLIAASPRMGAGTLAAADPQLARATAHAARGPVDGARTPSTFTMAQVPGTSWHLVIAVPNSRLFASIAGWTLLVPWLVLALVTILGALLVALFARSLADRARLTTLSATMERTAQTDSLTDLYNRRALTEQLTRAAARARRHEEPLSVLMIDLDRFKQTNDSFGHEAGDQVLCTIADCMREVLRADDVFGRWGGDEFLVALPKTDGDGARVTAARLRDAAARIDLHAIGLPDGVPLSVGVATGTQMSPHDLIREADLELYRAKAGHGEGAGEEQPPRGLSPGEQPPRAVLSDR